MNVLDRVLLAIYAIVVGVASLLVVIHGYGANLLLQILKPLKGDLWTMAAAIAVFLLSLRFLLLRGKGLNHEPTFVHRTANGEIHISYQTLESLAIRAAQTVRGIQDIQARIVEGQNGIKIKIRAMIQPDLKMPDLSEQLQETVLRYVQDTSGIQVQAVSVLIRDIVNGQSWKRSKTNRVRVE
jgi:uncharacterized alkaline shock family protein YloU